MRDTTRRPVDRRRPPALLGLCVGIAALAPGAARAEAAPGPKYAVMPFSIARGIDAEATQLLDELLLTELSKAATGGETFIGAADITAVLGLEQQKQMLACDDESCMAEIGNALGVDFLVTTSLGRLGDGFIVNVKVIDPKAVAVVRRESLTVSGGEDKLATAVRGLAPVILGLQPAATPAAGAGPQASAAQPEAGGEADGLSGAAWAGIGAAALGAALLTGAGVAVGLADATLADPQSSSTDKEGAETLYGAGLFGLGFGGTLILAGAAVALFMD